MAAEWSEERKGMDINGKDDITPIVNQKCNIIVECPYWVGQQWLCLAAVAIIEIYKLMIRPWIWVTGVALPCCG